MVTAAPSTLRLVGICSARHLSSQSCLAVLSAWSSGSSAQGKSPAGDSPAASGALTGRCWVSLHFTSDSRPLLSCPVTPFLSQPLSVCSCSSQTFPSCLPVPKRESDWLAVLTLPRAIRPHLLLVLSPSLCPQPEWPQQCFVPLLLVLTPWLPTLSSHLLALCSISVPLGTKLRRWPGLHCTCPGGRGAAPACGVDLIGPAEALAAALVGAHDT